DALRAANGWSLRPHACLGRRPPYRHLHLRAATCDLCLRSMPPGTRRARLSRWQRTSISSERVTEVSETPLDAAPQTRWLARVHVTLKPAVLDPQGDAVLMGLHQLGFIDVAAVRVGKYLELTLAAEDQQAAGAAVGLMCKRLLANPVIERYDFT